MNTARRSQWRPANLRIVIAALAAAAVQSLSDAEVLELAQRYSRQSMERRILLALPHAARSLTVNDEMAKEAGWFDPVIVGSSAFGAPKATSIGARNGI